MDDPKTVDEIVELLAELEDAERSAWLDEHVPDAELRERVERELRLLDDLAAGGGLDLVELVAENDLAAAPTEIGGYEIRARIGQGGMGVVYLAHDPRVDRLVAVKTLLDERARRRFAREARTLGRLDHPGIVPIYQFDPDAAQPFLAMEFVPGSSLEERLALERQRGADVGDEQRQRIYVELVARVADALEHAHGEGVVHRDVKPANILIDAEQRPRVTDFGVAKLDDDFDPRLTQTGERPGTLRYMSPEQARVERSEAVDRRSDVFSLGVVLYECLTLAPAFTGKTAEQVLTSVLEHEPPRLAKRVPGVDEGLERIVAKALEKPLERRYQSAAALAGELRAWLDGGVVQAPRLSWVRQAVRWTQRHAGALLVAGLVGLALVAGMGVQHWLAAPRATLALEVFTNAPRDPDGDVTVELRRVAFDGAMTSIRRDGLAWRSAREFSLPPGRYRVDASTANGWSAETQVVLDAERRTPLRLCLVAPDDDADDMALVPGGGGDPPFLIDREEVSNAHYAEFLASLAPSDAARLRPTWWPDGGPPASLFDRPVVGVTLEGALCYAAWAGKRLPSAGEWERAVAGDDGRVVPWGRELPDDPACFANTRVDAGFGNVVRDLTRHERRGPDHDALLDDFVASLQPVGAPVPPVPCDVGDPSLRDETAAGVRHLYGNVMEWTTSPSQEMWRSNGETIEFAVKGRAWRDARQDHRILSDENRFPSIPLPVQGASGCAPSKRLAGIGFRCARSVSS